MAARSIWNGTITFGTIAVPVKVHSATQSRTVSFREVHEKDGAPIEHKRICPAEDAEVPYAEVVKGFEVAPDEFVVLEKDEVAAAAGERSRLLAIEDFVEAEAIDPVFYAKTYYLGVRDAEDAYRLLHAALDRTGRAGIARWVFHNREYLVAIRALDGILAMHTMRFHDQFVNPAKDLDVSEPSKAPSDREIDMAGTLVDSLHGPFEAEDFTDTYRQHILEYLDQKRQGKAPEPKAAEPPAQSDDLMAALEASLKATKAGK